MEVKLESFDSTETDMSDIQTMSTPARTPSPVNSISSQVDYKPQILPGPGSSNLLAIPQIASYAKYFAQYTSINEYFLQFII